MTTAFGRPRVAFRTDASIEIGTGHVMRCLTLASALRDAGVDCVFLCHPHKGHLLDVISKHGFLALALPVCDEHAKTAAEKVPESDPPHASWLGTNWVTDARDSRAALFDHVGEGLLEWLIVDHYGLDARWEKALRPACKRLMVIDDLADRPHDCDLLLDQGLGRVPEDYAGLIPAGAAMLPGAQYALLRPEFAELRAENLARRATPVLKRILVTMGGIDKDNATTRVLDALDASALPADVTVTVVMGPQAPWLDAVRARAVRMRLSTEVHVGVRDMARLMTDCDLAIGAGGTTTWERCALGVPTITVVVAQNQDEVARNMAGKGATVRVAAEGDLRAAILRALDGMSPNDLSRLSKVSSTICDGVGTPRVVGELVKSQREVKSSGATARNTRQRD